MDPDPDSNVDPDPAIFVIDLPKMPTKKLMFLQVFLLIMVL
jgi:hypothetical protein